ncbi:MAG: KpsF/GutQ family sugar-phosphate isomerase [Planctomycetes bacterium]|nr:KpsF/GutQ family sugar-phosphate isomerase [Planctomycetota bacterium]
MTTSAIAQEARFIADALAAEAGAVQRLADRVAGGGAEAESFSRALDLLEGCTGSLIVSGMGKSGLVGAKISATFASLGQPSLFVHPSEAAHGDLGRVRRGDMALLLSYSGETEELLALAGLLRADGVARIGISKGDRSGLAGACDQHLALGDIEEACPLNLAPTASTTAMLAGDALALALARRRNFRADDFHRMHPGGMLGTGLRPVLEVVRFRVGRNLPCVDMGGTLAQALHAAGDGRRAGALMVVDGQGRLAGLVTDGDVRRLVNTRGAAALGLPLGDCMTRHPRTLPAEALVRDAVRLMRELRVDELPVVDGDGRPLGLLDVQDLVALKVVRD